MTEMTMEDAFDLAIKLLDDAYYAEDHDRNFSSAQKYKQASAMIREALLNTQIRKLKSDDE